MKTFVSALIIGILLGSIATHYFSAPDAYETLKEEKALLLHTTSPEDELEPIEDIPPEELEPQTEGEPIVAPYPDPSDTEEFDPENQEPPSGPIDARDDEAPQDPEAEQTAAPTIDSANQDEQSEAEPTEDKADPESKQSSEETVPPSIGTSKPKDLETAIRSQLEADERIDASNLSINVEDDLVTLSGTVQSAEAKRIAIEIAVFTEGVAGVEEKLEIVTDSDSD